MTSVQTTSDRAIRQNPFLLQIRGGRIDAIHVVALASEAKALILAQHGVLAREQFGAAPLLRRPRGHRERGPGFEEQPKD